MDNLFEQLANISKAHTYDIIVKHRNELLDENKLLRDRVKYLESLINEYTGKILDNLKPRD